MTTWFELSRDLKAGDRVVFTAPLDRFSEDLIVPSGTTCMVVANGLNEMHPTLFLLPDDPEIRKKLAAWDGEILLTCLRTRAPIRTPRKALAGMTLHRSNCFRGTT